MERTISGKTVFFDPEDLDIFDAHKWYAGRSSKKNSERALYYAFAFLSRSKRIFMHRVIMARVIGVEALERTQIVDHIDYNPLNNRRSNLRICKQGENVFHQRLRVNNTSGTRGVRFDKTRNAWRASICFESRHYFIGRYQTEHDALVAYDAVAKMLRGAFHDIQISKRWEEISELNTRSLFY